MKVALVRHGTSRSTEVGSSGKCPADSANPLTTLGVAQMEAFAAWARGNLTHPVLYTSVALRALESANVVSKALGIQLDICTDLREIIELKSERIVSELQVFYKELWATFYNNEHRDVTVIREIEKAERAIKKIVASSSCGADVIYVSHGGLIELIVAGLVSGYKCRGYTVEYALQPGAFHLVDVSVGDGAIEHVRIVQMNCVPSHAKD